MQNPHAKRRIDLAQRLAKRLVRFDGIKAIVIAGSVARDYCACRLLRQRGGMIFFAVYVVVLITLYAGRF